MAKTATDSADHAAADIAILKELERKILWLATWTIHNANHVRPNADGLKVGGHQASSASLATIMTALYLRALRPEDRVAVKPHASPIFHAIQYLSGKQTREKLENFRAYGGAQSYPSRTKDIDDVDFSTGSVGLGVAQTLFASLVQDYLAAKGLGQGPEGKMVALVGDAEMDEGNIFEALLEGWKHGLRNTWWIVDYNRQSLDAVVREGLWERFESIFRNFGWDVVILKYGQLQQAAFREKGGAALKRWIDTCPNPLYSALTFQGGKAWRKRLMDDIGDQSEVSALLDRRSDDELAALMGNLGGHDLPSLVDAFEAARRHDRPVCFIAYTIKGFGLPLAGHKDNHAGLMTPTQVETLRTRHDVRPGHEWDLFEGLATPPATLQAFLDAVPFHTEGTRRHAPPKIEVPAALDVPLQPAMSTQQGFGLLLNEIGKREDTFARRVVTTSPDVTVSTNLGAWVNRRKLFAREELADTFKKERIPSTYNWEFAPSGQHLELGIAEMNLFTMLSALGLSHSLFGERLLPIGTLYDPFIERGLDALNYACYQDARFIIAATPSGVTLAPEGGAHQSIATPLIGMAQDGLASFEPAFVDELAVILRFAFAHVQAEDGGSASLRLSTRTIEQPRRTMDAALAADIVKGGYWLRRPGPNAQVVIAYSGALAPEAIEAVGLIAEDRRDVGLLAVTSADLLHGGWTQAQRAREAGDAGARAHVETLLDAVPPGCAIISAVDGHPATLGWLGAVHGHRARALGVEHFGQTGTIADLYRHVGIDAQGMVRAAQAMAPGRPIRHLRAVG
ncbi:transketolase [Ancylobacter dichloromethanicus]|uniref:Pyruvate dehydrogenase E1 component n=1 Tax=Ancylobacter dichloromethanicus TaxID=518825 RepID=A0A9W6JA53_9HYPH|nr:transketolase [Ancylobacter dichloromethanicus]MBS7556577.1 transketolase [Ancylobacter dichloromethanicus]GLK72528.1 pyruvate dehydrogenase E1 component [Ancylobacter dichloromethanicus]